MNELNVINLEDTIDDDIPQNDEDTLKGNEESSDEPVDPPAPQPVDELYRVMIKAVEIGIKCPTKTIGEIIDEIYA